MGEIKGRMDLILFRHLWGVTGKWEDLFPRFRATGYRGIESEVPPPEDRKRFRAQLRQHGLEFIPQIFSRGQTVEEHLESLREQISTAKAFTPRLSMPTAGRTPFPRTRAFVFSSAPSNSKPKAAINALMSFVRCLKMPTTT